MYGLLSSSNALNSASLSFIMFIFLITSFDAWDCYYFESNPSLILLEKMFLTWKTSIVGLQPSKHEEITFLVIFCVYLVFHWGDTIQKKKVKMWRVRRKVFRATLSELICQLLLKNPTFQFIFWKNRQRKFNGKPQLLLESTDLANSLPCTEHREFWLFNIWFSVPLCDVLLCF